ncbi:hypothetical protein CLAFUR4_14489 [Fulvia fulva]|nr:hypothetical protein CLAFUR4_14489 [Fulvia fulva]WPV37453.1 hypothetical protein CLAFUW7_14498 [Fulvia fulva]
MPSERESTARAVIIAELASRPYWHRLWIVQECALATDLFILCGNSIAKASTLWHHKTVFNYTGEEAMWTVLGLKSGEMVSLSLQDAVIKFRDWPCFDPRDRIYDLAALIKWPSRRQIAIDYNTSSTDLCRQAMTYCNDSRGFDALLQTLGQRSEASLELAGIALCKSMQDFRTVCRLLSLTKTDDQDTIQAAMTFFRSIREIKDLEIVAQFKITIQERMKLAWEKLSLCSGGADVRTLVQTLDVAAAVDLAFIQAAMLRIERDWDRLKRAFLLSSSWVSDYDRLHLCTKLVHPAKSKHRWFITWDWPTESTATPMELYFTTEEFLLLATSSNILGRPRYACNQNVRSFVKLEEAWVKDESFSEQQAMCDSIHENP